MKIPQLDPRGSVAILLAIGLCTSINLITLAILWDSVFHSGGATMDENSTQVITTMFSGIIGVLGAYIGFKAGHDQGVAQGKAEERAEQQSGT